MRSINDGRHLRELVKVHAPDSTSDSLRLDRLVLARFDVEAYELNTLEGAGSILAIDRPTLMLEMDSLVLKLWRKISIPAFSECVFKALRQVHAINDGRFLCFRDEKASHHFAFDYHMNWSFMGSVTGFYRGAAERARTSFSIRRPMKKTPLPIYGKCVTARIYQMQAELDLFLDFKENAAIGDIFLPRPVAD